MIPREYEQKWEKKTQRLQAGILFTTDEWKTFWVINQIPTNWGWKFNVFEPKQDSVWVKESPQDDLPF